MTHPQSSEDGRGEQAAAITHGDAAGKAGEGQDEAAGAGCWRRLQQLGLAGTPPGHGARGAEHRGLGHTLALVGRGCGTRSLRQFSPGVSPGGVGMVPTSLGTRAEPAWGSCCQGTPRKRCEGLLPTQGGGSMGMGRGPAQLTAPGASLGGGGTQMGVRCDASRGVWGGTLSSLCLVEDGGDVGRVGVSFGLDLDPGPLGREF